MRLERASYTLQVWLSTQLGELSSGISSQINEPVKLLTLNDLERHNDRRCALSLR